MQSCATSEKKREEAKMFREIYENIFTRKSYFFKHVSLGLLRALPFDKSEGLVKVLLKGLI